MNKSVRSPRQPWQTPVLPDKPTRAETERLARIAATSAGLHLNPNKVDFFAQRLQKRLQKCGKQKYRDYCDYLESSAGASEMRFFVEALTTHTTSFFREIKHFDWLRSEGWEGLMASGAGREWPLRIWSAASSHGAELYSALISFKEFDKTRGLHGRVEGVGTDISQAILDRARLGVFSGNEISGLTEPQRRAFILRARDGSDRFRIVPELRMLTTWSKINLTSMGNAGPSVADLILLRNVLIYFDPPTQARVIAGLCARLRPGGVLLTGHSETVAALPSGMVTVAASSYRKDG